MKRVWLAIAIVLAVAALSPIAYWERMTVRQSAHGFVVGDHLVMGEYGYTDEGASLRYAIFRTWPRDSTPEQRALDSRTGRGFLGWPLIRNNDGRMVPVGADGDVYLFEGENLKTLKVRMNEHDDTIPLDKMQSLVEVRTYLEQFRVDD